MIMMFVYDNYLPNLGNRTDIQWKEVLQQHQIKMSGWSAGLIVQGRGSKTVEIILLSYSMVMDRWEANYYLILECRIHSSFLNSL